MNAVMLSGEIMFVNTSRVNNCHCEESDDVAILDNAAQTSSSSARAVLAGSICHPDLDTDCHVVELLAMTMGHASLSLASLQSVNNVPGNYS